MKKIIVPTDFSDTARNAYAYASALAAEMNQSLKVVNICHPSTDSINGIQIPLLPELLETRRKRLDQFVHQKPSTSMDEVISDTLVEQEVIIGFAIEELIKISKEPDTNMIVMGTTGQGGILEKLFGSVSSTVAQQAESPVWLVPPNVRYEGLRDIMYASNYQSADEGLIRQVVTFAEDFNANIHMVHVEKNNQQADYKLNKVLIEQLFRKKAPSLEFRMNVLQGPSVWQSLYQYAEDHSIDLIVLATKHRNFWEHLFHKSMTKSMVLNANTPLLVVHLDA